MTTNDVSRYKKVLDVLNESVHLRWTEAFDSAHGISEGEHKRRHYTWISGLITGIAFAMEYPKLAVRIGQLVRNQKEAEELHLEFVTDWLARYVGEAGWPVEQKPELLKALREAYAPENVDSGAKAVFSDEGVLTWVERSQGEFPLETYHETWEDWSDVT